MACARVSVAKRGLTVKHLPVEVVFPGSSRENVVCTHAGGKWVKIGVSCYRVLVE